MKNLMFTASSFSRKYLKEMHSILDASVLNELRVAVPFVADSRRAAAVELERYTSGTKLPGEKVPCNNHH